MTDGKRDGILDPRASETVAKPPELEAFDRWAAEPDNTAAWEAARRWLAHSVGDGDVLDVARTALLLAREGPERERARRELLDLLADRRPLPASAGFRPAGNITDRLPRPILRAAGLSGSALAEGAVCLLSGAGGAAKSTLATTLALDVAYGGELADPEAAGSGRRDGQGVLRPIRRAARAGKASAWPPGSCCLAEPERAEVRRARRPAMSASGWRHSLR